ncbi:MAG: DsrE family protein [Gemmatimonadetes bacterium]|nr:DsrE family protein [Gemmatimonadota bacterium]
MRTLLVVNDPPYGSERCYNALRLAISLKKREADEVRVFLMGDAASCAKAGQKLAEGYYHLERMLKILSVKGGEIGVCGSCMDARGLRDEDLGVGPRRSSLDELTDWTRWADKVMVF